VPKTADIPGEACDRSLDQIETVSMRMAAALRGNGRGWTKVKAMFRTDKWILDPFWVIAGVFGTQALVWWLWMPEIPTIRGAAPRFYDEKSIFRYLFLLISLLGGVALGKVVYHAFVRKSSYTHLPVSRSGTRLMAKLARWALLLALLGELVYVRSLLLHPYVIVQSLERGWFASVGELVRAQRIVGLSSLNNLFLVPTAAYAILAFDPSLDTAYRARARRRMILLGLAVFTHALLLVARMFFVYYVLVVVGAYILMRPKDDHKRSKAIWGGLALLVLAIWLGETLRGGVYYAHAYATSPLSLDAQRYVRGRLIEGYLAADFNNAMVVLNCPPSMQFVTGTLFGVIAKAMGFTFYGYDQCPQWGSAFGTMNVLAIWWFDAGWFALTIALSIGALLGFSYKWASRNAHNAVFSRLFYLVAYPGLFSMARINYYGLTIFVLPVAFLVCMWLFSQRYRRL